MQNELLKYIKISVLPVLGMLFILCSCGSSRFMHQSKPKKFSADELFMKGQRMKLQHHSEKAIAYFKAFQKLKPQNATVYFEIARQYNNLRKPDSVLVYAEKAARLSPSNKWVQQFYARTLANDKQYTMAAEVFRRLAEAHLYSDDFVFQEALMLFHAKKYKEALPLFESLEKEKGVDEAIVFQKQRIYIRLHQIDSAAEEIQKLIDKSPDEGRYYALLAKMYARNNKPVQAVNVYKSLLQGQPHNAQAQLALGILYKQMDSIGKFKKYINKAFHNPAFSIEKKIRFIYPFLQYVEVDSTERPDAIWLCRLLTHIHHQDARAYALFGDMYFRCKETDSALSQYKKAIHHKHAHYEIWNQIMLIYAQKGKVDSLMTYSKKAVHCFPDNARARYFNGLAFYFKGRNKSAASELQYALKIGIKNTKLKQSVYQSLTNIYMRLDDREKATKYRKLAEAIRKKEDKKSSLKKF